MSARILMIVLLVGLLPACAASVDAQPATRTSAAASPSGSPGSSEPEAVSSPSPSDTSTPPPRFSVSRLGPWSRVYVIRNNWRPGCPVPVSQLRMLRISYVGFDGDVHSGPMVVNKKVADDVLWVFRRLFAARFPIKKIALAGRYRPNAGNYDSPVRNVTAAFSCRPVTDTTSVFSQHSYGWAVDVNPLENPYVRSDGTVLRRADEPYAKRSRAISGMIRPGDLIVRLFARIGFEWGGEWNSVKDYMHFSLTGT